jgi:hypothetical protein
MILIHADKSGLPAPWFLFAIKTLSLSVSWLYTRYCNSLSPSIFTKMMLQMIKAKAAQLPQGRMPMEAKPLVAFVTSAIGCK